MVIDHLVGERHQLRQALALLTARLRLPRRQRRGDLGDVGLELAAGVVPGEELGVARRELRGRGRRRGARRDGRRPGQELLGVGQVRLEDGKLALEERLESRSVAAASCDWNVWIVWVCIWTIIVRYIWSKFAVPELLRELRNW